MKEKLLWAGSVATNAVLFLGALYLVWGWITVADLRVKCEKAGLDPEQVMSSLITTGPDIKTIHTTNGDYSVQMTWQPSKYPSLSRYAMSFSKSEFYMPMLTNNPAGKTNRPPEFSVMDGGLLEPFLGLTDNVVNFLFAFGLGYVMSCAILLVKSLRKNSLTPGYVFLRPLAGGIVSACLFLVVLAGGKVFWEKASPVNSPSVGILAAFGAGYCERFERWLKYRFAQKEQ